mgnify:CR=1 FL=1
MRFDLGRLVAQNTAGLESALQARTRQSEMSAAGSKQVSEMTKEFEKEFLEKRRAFEAAMRKKQKKSGGLFGKIFKFLAPVLPPALRFMGTLVHGHRQGTKARAHAKRQRAEAEKYGMFGADSRWHGSFLEKGVRDYDASSRDTLDAWARQDPSGSDLLKGAILPAISSLGVEQMTFKDLIKSYNPIEKLKSLGTDINELGDKSFDDLLSGLVDTVKEKGIESLTGLDDEQRSIIMGLLDKEGMDKQEVALGGE